MSETIVAKGAGNQTLTSYHYKAYPTVIFEGRMPEFRNGMLVPTINPTSVGLFVDGVWNGQVTINETGVARIIVEGTNGDVSPRQGSSNEFTVDTNVHSSPETTSEPNVIPNPSRISPSSIPSPNASSTSATNIDPSSIIDSSGLTLYSGLTLVVATFIVVSLLVYYKKHKRGTV